MQSTSLSFYNFFKAVPHPILVINEQRNIEMPNNLLLKLFGYEEEELLGKHVLELFPVKQQNRFTLQLETFLNEYELNKNQEILLDGLKDKNRVVSKSGELFPVEIVFNALPSKAGLFVLISFTNISKRAQAEKNYKQVFQKLQIALSSSMIGIWEYDFATNEMKYDDNMRALYELAPEEEVDSFEENWKKRIHPEDATRVKDNFRKAIINQRNYQDSFRIIVPGGYVRYIKSRGKVIFYKSGKPIRILGTNIDITSEREYQVIQKENYERNKLFIEQAPTAIAMLDKNMCYLAASKKWMTDYKLTRNIIGKSHYKVFPEIPEEWKEIHQKCLKGGLDISDESMFEREDGSVQWISWEIKPWYINKNEIGGILMYTANLTSLKENYHEKLRLQNMLNEVNEVAGIGFWEINLESNEVYWSSTTKEIHEVEEDYMPLLEEGINFYVEEDRERISSSIEQTLHTGKTFEGEFQIITAKGNKRWVKSIGLLEQVEGKNKRLYGIFQDITNSKNYEKTLVKARQKAEAASKSKSEFLANMSHEIRTPLNGVIGFTDLLMKTSLTKNQMGYLKTVNNSANLLLDVINDILDFSKIEAGKLELNTSPVDIHELCKETIDILKHQVNKRKVEILLNISPNLEKNVYADEIRLKQIVTNLLNNAIKFTEEGEIELKVSIAKEQENDGNAKLRFSVRDTGKGIAKEQLSKIFNAFDQEDASITRKYGGTGLGLTISNQLLKLMESELKVTSELGKGSVFYFEVSFPIATEEAIDLLRTKKYTNVLVVDDNEQNREILREMLQQLKVNCREEANGVEAIQTLMNEKDFDLIISDYDMPFMNGVDFITYLRNNFEDKLKDIDIMLLHSIADDQIVGQAAKELNLEYVFEKPLSFKDLGKVIKPEMEPGEEEILDDIVMSSSPPTGLNVLVVEDNPVNTLLIKEILTKLLPTAHLTCAVNGKEAVALCENSSFDLLFMDVQMPVMSGLEATEKIRQLEAYQDTPIIALTARILQKERDECLESGMNSVLIKPLKYQAIKKVIGEFNYE
ncbi:PAS domain-containing hybrid sensor histidine kinase/response regulator [Mesonia oceanica]|uniref:Signal transduction histidine-protein kinase BarA n=1 Tax=Mesonia oceanica TaxID=2687242 RepID=A0AC61Y5A5_9FLAO|nr:PAS domain-containing hybrid sensor histidine kinase/response regulator [Mesonia oceanica]MAQ42777.1 hypothetical protein [Mesonia sp.]MBJ99315.1 hypothetical protein [Flavobacteriaceae bacterium]VVU99685.1 Signal transduction histidine-protein kinase BarA [Mesonia oceanica]|tara:strand:+ start:39799 stop:42906 length:3108 start_codon:yes stop_codon:yes gene_type:complete